MELNSILISILQEFKKMDFSILNFIHNTTQNPVFDKTMPFITWLGNMGLVWIAISILLILNKKYRSIGIMCIAALILTAILGEAILKNIIQRPRPFLQVPVINLLITKPMSYSFPSGHTASSFAVVGIIFSTIKKFRIHAIILAILIAFSRMYLYVHYPSDILGGILLGLLCSKVVLLVYKNKFHPRKRAYH
jgi:undecaprenyl-diphosphatase